jgi:hypothetical protein
VGPGLDGRVVVFAPGGVAMQPARAAARRVWAELGTLSCVKLLSEDGTWETVDVFGIEPLPR